ncbi:MAG: bifunctional 2',3'-cyclic-nucleotide 2'-phosphodiesterase/3'-nucleotidase [Alphaproteobacteria bacterium]|nr:bifunctional 2',3'-cyclic-nucleotide 2'-phosphodiesterase/3'-nucleotidase [Alphaproteobacteria bacterium]
MKKTTKLLLLSSLATLSLMSVASAETINLRIMETTDLHVHMVDYDYYSDQQNDQVGLAKVSSLLTAARAEVTNSMFFDNGDLLQGNPLGDYVAKKVGLKPGEIHPVYKAMNLLNYDAGNIGNHEFNYGLEFLKISTDGANFPYTNSNVYVDDGDGDKSNDKNLFPPYLMLEREFSDTEGNMQQVTVGVIGFTPPQIMQWDKVNLEGKVWAADIVDTANKYVPIMKAEGADIIIAIPHSGISSSDRVGGEANASAYLSEIEGIDAILFGHSHAFFPSSTFKDFPGADVEKGTLNGVPSTMPGFWGSHLGVIDLELEKDGDGWKRVDGQSEIRGIYRRDGRTIVPLVTADNNIVKAVEIEHLATIAYMNEKLGKLSAPINSYFALMYDDPSIQIVNNAQLAYVKQQLQGTEYGDLPVLSAAAPFKSGGRIGASYYTALTAGDIAYKNIADLYIYPNTLHIVKMNGAEVKEWLEMSARQFLQIDPTISGDQELINPDFRSYNFDVIDGIDYEIDITVPVRYNSKGEMVSDSHRIKNVMFDGQPLDDNMMFAVATNNYRASGGGSFPGLDGSKTIVESPDQNRIVLGNYIFEQGTIDPSADGNWKFAPIGTDVNVVFISSPDGEDFGRAQGMEVVGEAPDGFTQYRLVIK